MPPPTAQEEKEQTECINAAEPEEELPEGFGVRIDGAPQVPLPWPSLDQEQWLQSQLADQVLVEVQVWFNRGERPSKEKLRGRPQVYHCYAQVPHSLTMGADRILKYMADTFLGQTDRYLVPEDKKMEVFQMVHEISSAGHFGIHATAALALRHFWYPGLNADIRIRIKSCVVCITVRTKAGAHMPGTSGFPGQTLYVDLVQMSVSSQGYHYILSMEDGFSRFISLAPVKSKTAEEVIQALLDQYISRFGCPLVIHSDNGREFTNQIQETAGQVGGGQHYYTCLQPCGSTIGCGQPERIWSWHTTPR